MITWTQIKLYLIGALVAIFSLMALWLKRQSNQIEELEDENETLEATGKATTEQAEFKEAVIVNEQSKIIEEVSKSEKKSKLDRLNDL